MVIGPTTSVAGSTNVNPPPQAPVNLAGYQLGQGQQASGVREPAATLDLSQEARTAARVAKQAQEAESIAQPESEPLPVRDDEKRRRRGWHQRKPPDQESQEDTPTFAEILAEQMEHLREEQPHDLDVTV